MPSGEASEAAVPWNDALPTAPMPVLDWEALGSADPAVHKAELKKLEEIARTVGFFYLKNVPIEKSRLNRQFELAKQLFELPEEEKEPLNMGIKGEFAGYKRVGQMVLGPDGRKDINESYQIRKFINGDGGDQPALLNANAGEIESFQRDCHRTLMLIGRCLAEILAIPEAEGGVHFFDDRHRYEAKSGCVLRYVRYPHIPEDQPDDPESRRMAQHTDLGTLTLLWSTEGVGGLQVLSPKTNEWEWVKPMPGCAIVNLGDSIGAWSNGELKSNLHRVVRPPPGTPQVQRYTIVYFVRPEDDVPMSPIPSLAAKHGVSQSDEPVPTAKEWISRRVKNLMVANSGGNWKEFERGARWAGQKDGEKAEA